MKSLGLLGLLALSACGPTLYRDNTTREEFERDKAQCEYEATRATASGAAGNAYRSPVAAGYADSMAYNQVVLMCMRARGYTTARS